MIDRRSLRVSTYVLAGSLLAGVLALVPGVPGIPGLEEVPPVAATPAATYAATVMADEPTYYWRLGDPGYRSSAEIAGTPEWGANHSSAGGAAGALLGDSDDAFTMTGAVNEGTTPLADSSERTLEGWVKVTTLSGGGAFYISGTCNGSDLISAAVNPNGTVTARVNDAGSNADPSVTSSGSVVDGEWHHIVVVGRTGGFQLWIDGVIEGHALGLPQGVQGSCNANHHGWTPSGSFAASFDEFASYTQALTPQEIQDHYVASGRQPALTLSEMLGPNGALRNQSLVQQCECDPVDVATGNLHMPLPEVAVPGRGPGLAIPVGYNSLAADSDSVMGYGWSSLLGMRVDVAPGGKSATVVQETGATVPFEKVGSDWVAPERFIATLVESGGVFTFTRAHFEKLTFDSAGRLAGISDQFGNTTSLIYAGASAHVDYLVDEAGRRLTVGWRPDGRVGTITDPLTALEGGPRVASFDYDGNGDLTSYEDLSGGVWTFTYTNHRLTTMRKPRHQPSGPFVENGYDSAGRVIWQDDELNRRTQIDYDADGVDQTLVTLPGGRQRLHRFENGLRVETIDGYESLTDEVSTKLTFDPDTYAVETVEDNDGNITEFTDLEIGGIRDGNPDRVKDPTGRITEFTYDNFGQVKDTITGKVDTGSGVTTPNGTITTRNEYDPDNGRLEKVTIAFGSETHAAATDFVYGDSAHPEDVTRVTDARGKDWDFGYDPGTGYLDWSENPYNERTVRTYTTIGWPKTITTPKGVATPTAGDYQTTFGYNLASRTTTVTGPTGDVTRTVRDANGNTASVATGITGSNPTGDVTAYVYTAADELDTVNPPGVGDRRYTYRPDGTRETVTNELSATWTYGYDDAGRLETEEGPDAEVTTYTYDGAGRLHHVLQPLDSGAASCTGNPVGCISYTYDRAGRPKSVDYSDPLTPDVTGIDYDAFGRRTEATTNGVEEHWSWNQRSQLTAHVDANGRTTSYGWDGTGNMTSITYPGQTKDLTRTFDDAGRLHKVKDWQDREIVFDFDADSNWETTAFPGGAGTANTDRYTFDQAGRITSATWRQGGLNGTVLGSEAYTRPNTTKGMVDVRTPAGAAGSGSIDNGYDNRDRLTTAGSESFAYDPASNLTETEDGRLQVFNPAQQICWTSPSVASGTCGTEPEDATSFDYDARGNRTTVIGEDNDRRTHTYDQANRLTRVVDDNIGGTDPTADMSDTPIVGDFDGDGQDDLFAYKSGGTNNDVMWWGPTVTPLASRPTPMTRSISPGCSPRYRATSMATATPTSFGTSRVPAPTTCGFGSAATTARPMTSTRTRSTPPTTHLSRVTSTVTARTISTGTARVLARTGSGSATPLRQRTITRMRRLIGTSPATTHPSPATSTAMARTTSSGTHPAPPPTTSGTSPPALRHLPTSPPTCPDPAMHPPPATSTATGVTTLPGTTGPAPEVIPSGGDKQPARVSAPSPEASPSRSPTSSPPVTTTATRTATCSSTITTPPATPSGGGALPVPTLGLLLSGSMTRTTPRLLMPPTATTQVASVPPRPSTAGLRSSTPTPLQAASRSCLPSTRARVPPTKSTDLADNPSPRSTPMAQPSGSTTINSAP